MPKQVLIIVVERTLFPTPAEVNAEQVAIERKVIANSPTELDEMQGVLIDFYLQSTFTSKYAIRFFAYDEPIGAIRRFPDMAKAMEYLRHT